MPSDLNSWLDIIDRWDVISLTVLVVILWIRQEFKAHKKELSDDRRAAAVEKLLALHSAGIQSLNEWRIDHIEQDREDHRRMHERIDQRTAVG